MMLTSYLEVEGWLREVQESSRLFVSLFKWEGIRREAEGREILKSFF